MEHVTIWKPDNAKSVMAAACRHLLLPNANHQTVAESRGTTIRTPVDKTSLNLLGGVGNICAIRGRTMINLERWREQTMQ